MQLLILSYSRTRVSIMINYNESPIKPEMTRKMNSFTGSSRRYAPHEDEGGGVIQSPRQKASGSSGYYPEIMELDSMVKP